MEVDDPLRIDLDSLDVRPITEFKDYHGVNVSIMAYLDRTRIPISIDIGFGDVIVPERVILDVVRDADGTLLTFPAFSDKVTLYPKTRRKELPSAVWDAYKGMQAEKQLTE